MIITLIMGFNTRAQHTSPPGDKIVGLYWSPKKDAKIEIYSSAGRYYGKTVWLPTPKKDDNNPDERLRGRNLLGVNLLTNFTFSDDEYVGGKIYDPANGKTYSCKMTLNGKSLKVRGYIGISLFGRTETFERI
jgi:uncharacterized protein (DUF2147 family)